MYSGKIRTLVAHADLGERELLEELRQAFAGFQRVVDSDLALE